MKKITAHKLGLENISFDSDLEIAQSICVLSNAPEQIFANSDSWEEDIVRVAKQCAFFSWEYTDDDTGVYPFCSFTICGNDIVIDGDTVPYMKGHAMEVAKEVGCKFFIDLTPHDMGKAYNAARLSNRAEREFNTYCR